MRTLLLLTLLVTGLSVPSFAAIIHIPDDYPSIQNGLAAAVPLDTIQVASGTYFENIAWPSTYGLKLVGSGAEDCFIDGNQQASVIRFEDELEGFIDSNTLISGFTIQSGYPQGDLHDSYGGGIYFCGASPFIENVTISNNSAFMGAGIFCWINADPILQNVTISDNSTAQHGGGIYSCGSNPTLLNTTISNNSVSGCGGGICSVSSFLSLANVTVIGNYAGYQGGGIYCQDSDMNLVNVTISDNGANQGGGICCWESTSLNITNSVLWSNFPEEVFFSPWDTPNQVMISCSNVEGGQAGIDTNNNGTVYWQENNIDADPLFCDPENDDYRIDINSPCRTDVCGFMGYTGETCEGEDVPNVGAWLPYPSQIYLSQNYPNPFNPSTTIEFSLPSPQDVQLVVYNLMGQEVATLADGVFAVGIHQVTFDTHVGAYCNTPLSSGVYIYQLSTDDDVISRKMILVR